MRCGLVIGMAACDAAAIGVLQVQAFPGEELTKDIERAPAMLPLCPQHLAKLGGGPAEAVFDEGLPQPRYPSSHQPDVTLGKE